MIHLFSGKTANEVFQAAHQELQSSQNRQEGRNGETIELLHAAFSISNPLQRWSACREPAINPAFALAEVVWILNGSNDASFLNKWNAQLPNFSGSGDTYHGAYGHRLRKHFTLDQLDRAYKCLKNNSASRQVVLQIWDSKTDMPNELGQPANPDIPCNIVSLLKVRDQKLEWTQIMRSNDLFRGTPYNFIQFTSLQEILAGWLSLKVGSYNHISDSLHFYVNDLKKGVSLVESNCEPNTDSLMLAKELSEKVFNQLYILINDLENYEISEQSVKHLINNCDLPDAYRNILIVMLAEKARKAKLASLALTLISTCTNPAFKQAWRRWNARFEV